MTGHLLDFPDSRQTAPAWVTNFAPILTSFSLNVLNDQCFTLWGSVSLRRKLPRLYAKVNSCIRTWLSTKSWHESRVHFTAFLPSLRHCSDVTRPVPRERGAEIPRATHLLFVRHSRLASPRSRYSSASGLVGVWTEENTQESIFEAFRHKETWGSTGPRIQVRFFGASIWRV